MKDAITWLEDNTNDKHQLARIVDALLFLWKKKIKEWLSEQSFWDLMKWIEDTLDFYNISKVYNSTVLPSLRNKISSSVSDLIWMISSSTWLDLKINWKWWTCFDWAVLITEVFSEIEPNWEIEVTIIQFANSIHTSVLVSYAWRKFIIDPFSKWWWYTHELKDLSKIYLWERNWKRDYAEVESLDPLNFFFDWETIGFRGVSWEELCSQINFKTFWWVLRVKDFYEWELLTLDIDIHSDKSDRYTVEFDEVVTYWGISTLKSLVNSSNNSYDFLIWVIDYNSPELSFNQKKKLRYLSKKIDIGYLKDYFFGSSH